MTISLFACVPLSCRLSPTACAARHREANAGPAPGVVRPLASACVHCAVGAGHAAGGTPTHWPDGTQIVRLGIAPRPSAEPMPPPKKVTRLATRQKREPVREETPMPAARMITFNDETLSCTAWGARFNVSGRTIALRDDAGKHPDGTPRDAPKPKAAGREPPPVSAPAAVAALDPVELLKGLGFDVTSPGVAPNGVQVLFVVRAA